ncbi:lysostaphin resistance A-like protein, partial [Candidatus Latescibacterota bacterium]
FLAILPIIFITTIFIGGPIAEELGWRGYAQPRLQAQLGAGFAGLIIGFVWSLWHLPLFYYFPSAVGEMPVGHYIPLVSALGVLFAWLYNRTGGSVLLCILLHAGGNFAMGAIGKEILTTNSRLLTIFVVLMGILALVLYLRIRSVRDVLSSSQ